ncbi:hypothetical protein AB0M86_29765 [Streptomyces sp. NPDC051639]|uniref:hypothetical protein n=1 Tax=Streptomyces sp. NPDC051639 TaxID=3155671 RepID=UPI003428D892
MTQALAPRGVTAHLDEDAGSSWLVISLDGTDFPAEGTPKLVVFVYDANEASSFVDQPMEHRGGSWRVTFDNGTSQRDVFYGRRADPATATALCAEFIAEYLSAPSA